MLSFTLFKIDFNIWSLRVHVKNELWVVSPSGVIKASSSRSTFPLSLEHTILASKIKWDILQIRYLNFSHETQVEILKKILNFGLEKSQ